MAQRYRGNVLLVGSIPLESEEEVFRACTQELGPWVSSLPDGEVGERKNWVYTVCQDAYDGHPDLEGHKVPLEDHMGKKNTKDAEQRVWHFRIRDGVETLKLDGLRFAETAANSYRILCRLRDEGAVRPDVRFQVALPTTHAVVDPFFRESRDRPKVTEAYHTAIKAEIEKLCTTIPAEDLVIQWDVCTEVIDLLAGDEPIYPWCSQMSLEDKWKRHIADMGMLSVDIPEDIQLGYHFCFGTSRGWPNTTAPDMEVCTRLSNSAVEVAGRRVDYVHIPVLPDADEGFFRPLKDLDIGDTKPVLGLVVHDSVSEFERRTKAASQYISDFGVASYCGWGREKPEMVPQHLRDLREAAEILYGK